MKSPERYLFRAVISQAIHDAMYNGLDKYYLIDKRNAIDWLIGNSVDFKTICSWADIDPDIACKKFTAAMKLNTYVLTEDQYKVLNKPRKEYKHKGKFRLTFNDA